MIPNRWTDEPPRKDEKPQPTNFEAESKKVIVDAIKEANQSPPPPPPPGIPWYEMPGVGR